MSEETLVIGDVEVPADEVTDVRILPGERDTRPLIVALASLLLAVLIPTFAVGAGVDFVTVAPVGVVLFLITPVGLGLWLRSGERMLIVETGTGTYRARITDEERAQELRQEYGSE